MIGWTMVLTVNGIEVAKARDVSLAFEGEGAEMTTRAGAGWKEFVQCLKSWEANIEQLWVPTNAGLRAIRASYFDETTLSAEFRDEDGYGFDGDGIVVGLELIQPLDEGAMLNAKMISGDAATVQEPAAVPGFLGGGSNPSSGYVLEAFLGGGEVAGV